jgi:hypothetical protein
MNRRTLLRGLLALPFAPLVAKIAPGLLAALPKEEIRIASFGNLATQAPGFPSMGVMSAILKEEYSKHSKQIADNVFANNALLKRLRRDA